MDDHDYADSSLPPSRSPSPVSRRGYMASRAARRQEHESIVRELARNGYDYVTLDTHGGRLSSSVREEDVKKFFTGFEIDKVRGYVSGKAGVGFSPRSL